MSTLLESAWVLQVFWDFLGNNTSELIAACALGLTVYQAALSRRHNKLSVKPHLTTFTHSDELPGRVVFAFRVINNGIGPAFIKCFRILLDGSDVSDHKEALKTVLSGSKFDHSVEGVEESLVRFDLIIEYESAYGERGKIDTRTGESIVNN